jgi:hypothetical protein
LAWPAAAIGAVNGAISGARRIYQWRGFTGPVALILDSTWALPMTAGALAAHGVAFAQRGQGGFIRVLSERANRHVYARGVRLRKGFVITIGNTVNGAGDHATTSPRRHRLITDHEDVHVWQARWWGPLFPLLYVGWTITGGVAGAAIWAMRRRDERFTKVVETCSYYLNPFEWWAYSRDDHWPPSEKVPGLGWATPIVRPFSERPTRRRLAAGGRPAPPVAPR